MPVPYTFGTATAAIPLSQLDSNFATAITLGNTAVYLGNTTTSLGNVTLTNVTISSGNVIVTGANVSGTANVSTLIVTGNQTSLGNVAITGNISANIATFGAGSNTAPSITTTGDTNTGIFFPAADTVGMSTGGAEAMRIDSSGNVGIGTSSPTSKLNIASGGAIRLNRTDNNAYSEIFCAGSGVGTKLVDSNGDGFRFFNTATQVATIDSSGNLGVGTTTPNSAANYGFFVQPAGNGANIPYAGCSGNSSSNSQYTWEVYSKSLNQSQFYVGYAGTVYARSTSITGLSDVSEKENIKPLETGLNEILALQPRRFDWKNGQAKNIAGFIAQEVQPILPDLIDEFLLDKETQETKLGLKMGDMIPTLVKAIQEQQAIITQLQADVAALKGSTPSTEGTSNGS
jgi:hypothetical protein